MSQLTVFLFLTWICVTQSGKILIIHGTATSHCLEMMAVGDELLRRGHEVTLFTLIKEPKVCIPKEALGKYKPQFKLVSPEGAIEYATYREEFVSNVSRAFFERKSMLKIMWSNLAHGMHKDCHAALRDKQILRELEKDRYDLAIVDGLPFLACFQAVAEVLNLPKVAISSYIDFQESRMPLQTNVFPSIFTEYSNEMTFPQRLMNLLYHLLAPLMKKIMIPSIDLSKYDKRLSGKDMRDICKDAILFLENSDYIVDYPKALYPNFVQAGGLTAIPAKPLPADLKNFMDGAKNGVVLVTFGSMLKDMPKFLVEKFMNTFSRLNHQILFKQNKDETRGNVRIMKWLPQNDILGHPNTKLFISHCGKNGFWESVYHGVPIICMAIHAETFTTKVKVRKYGIGSSIEIFDDTVDEMVQTINEVLGNESISRNMKMKSTLLRDRRETARERAASAVEHVLKYGGDHMRPPPAAYSYLSYTCLDVWCTLGLVVVLVVWFDVWLIKRCCCRRKTQKPKTD